jgi:hypothetical protein
LITKIYFPIRHGETTPEDSTVPNIDITTCGKPATAPPKTRETVEFPLRKLISDCLNPDAPCIPTGISAE